MQAVITLDLAMPEGRAAMRRLLDGLEPPVAAGPSEGVHPTTPPLAPAHPSEGPTPADEAAQPPHDKIPAARGKAIAKRQDPPWAELVERVLAGHPVKEEAGRAGVSWRTLEGKVGCAMLLRAKAMAQSEWDALVAQVVAGGGVNEIARRAGVPWRQLDAKVAEARAAQKAVEPGRGGPAEAEAKPADAPAAGFEPAAAQAGEESSPATEPTPEKAEGPDSPSADPDEPPFGGGMPAPSYRDDDPDLREVDGGDGAAPTIEPDDEDDVGEPDDFDESAPRRAPPPLPDLKALAAARDPSWSPREDVAILRGYIGGQQSWQIAQRLKGRLAPDIVARFKSLVPQPGIDAQRKALEAAQSRLAAGR